MWLLVKTKKVLLRVEIKIEIPQDIMLDKKRLKSVQQGILKVISKGPYEEGLAFNIAKATFVDLSSFYNLPGTTWKIRLVPSEPYHKSDFFEHRHVKWMNYFIWYTQTSIFIRSKPWSLLIPLLYYKFNFISEIVSHYSGPDGINSIRTRTQSQFIVHIT